MYKVSGLKKGTIKRRRITNNNNPTNTKTANTTPLHKPPTSVMQLPAPRFRLSSINPTTTTYYYTIVDASENGGMISV